MSEATRHRRLHLENRLEELNAKYGPVDDELPDWLDHLPDKQPQRHAPAPASAGPLAPLHPPAASSAPPPRPISEDLPV